MDFAFINELMKLLESNNIFKFTFTGAKILALGLLLFRVLESFTKDFEGQDPKMGNILTILGYGAIIMCSDWIIVSIENVFSGVDVAMQSTSSDLYSDLTILISEKMKSIFDGADDVWDYMGAVFSNLLVIFTWMIAMLLGSLVKIADLSITASYLVVRVFIVKLLQFLFPLAIALSTYSGTQKLFHTWILRYIGVFILGIAYIGIINIMALVQSTIVAQFDVSTGVGTVGTSIDGGIFSIGILVAMVVTFTIKVKLFSSVTSYVSGMFQ